MSCVYRGFSSPSLGVWGVNCPDLLLFQFNLDSTAWKYKFQPFHCSAFPSQIFPGMCRCRTEPCCRKWCGFLWKTAVCTWNFRAVRGKTEEGKTLNLHKLFLLKGQIFPSFSKPISSSPCPIAVPCVCSGVFQQAAGGELVRELFVIKDYSPCCSLISFASGKDNNSLCSAILFEVCWPWGTDPLNQVQLAGQCLHQAGPDQGLTNKQRFCWASEILNVPRIATELHYSSPPSSKNIYLWNYLGICIAQTFSILFLPKLTFCFGVCFSLWIEGCSGARQAVWAVTATNRCNSCHSPQQNVCSPSFLMPGKWAFVQHVLGFSETCSSRGISPAQKAAFSFCAGWAPRLGSPCSSLDWSWWEGRRLCSSWAVQSGESGMAS